MWTLKRTRVFPDRVLGTLSNGDKSFCTLELPWKGNKPQVSCIPEGIYEMRVVPETSGLIGLGYKGKVISVKLPNGLEIPGRSGIFFHVGNFPKNTKGCILTGMNFDDKDVKLSALSISLLVPLIGESVETLRITSEVPIYEKTIVPKDDTENSGKKDNILQKFFSRWKS